MLFVKIPTFVSMKWFQSRINAGAALGARSESRSERSVRFHTGILDRKNEPVCDGLKSRIA